MKIKTDFVTNSSSSSFIVAFPNVVEKIEDVRKFIQGEDKIHTVFGDCQKQEPIRIETSEKCYKKIIEELNKGCPMSRKYGSSKEPLSYSPREQRKYLREEIGDEELIKAIDKDHTYEYFDILYLDSDIQTTFENSRIAKKFVSKNLGRFLYVFEYGDEDGPHFSELEHGGTFDSLEHVQISKH